MRTKSLILNNNSKQNSTANVKKFLVYASQLEFWKTHFKNKKFKFNSEKFNWDYFQSIPFVTKKDIEKLGVKRRLKDAKEIIDENPGRFLLQPTSGTSKQTGPLLFLKAVDCMIDGQSHEKGDRTLILYQGRAISLRDTLAKLNSSQNKYNPRTFVLNPFKFSRQMKKAVNDFKPDAVVTFPSSIGYLNSYFPDSSDMLSETKYLWLSGDFFSEKQKSFVGSILKKAYIDIDYITTEVDTVGICCKYLQKKYGTNAYHPFEDRLIELVDIDESGLGEVIVTKMAPLELSFIRYRTGDLARFENRNCECGAQIVIFLAGRKNMDYIKSLGVLVARAEIERVLKFFDNVISDWRGEVREKDFKGSLIGELTLILRLKPKKFLSDIQILKLKEDISGKLFLTPKKTLAVLQKENKFKGLKIQIVDDFQTSAKVVRLRKILD